MRWRPWYLLLIPLTIPSILASLVLALPYGVESWHWRGGCLELISKRPLWGRASAQCIGCHVIWYLNVSTWEDESVRVHERVHCVQGLFLGPLMPISYGAHFLLEYLRNRSAGWVAAYYQIWAERQALRVQMEFDEGKRPGAWGAYR